MDLGNIIWQLIVGLIVGVIARLLVPGHETAFPHGALGWLVTAILGILGALIGTFIARALWAGEGYAGAGWIMSIIGAVLLVILARYIFGSMNRSTV